MSSEFNSAEQICGGALSAAAKASIENRAEQIFGGRPSAVGCTKLTFEMGANIKRFLETDMALQHGLPVSGYKHFQHNGPLPILAKDEVYYVIKEGEMHGAAFMGGRENRVGIYNTATETTRFAVKWSPPSNASMIFSGCSLRH